MIEEKKLEAIIKPELLKDVIEELRNKDIHNITAIKVKFFGMKGKLIKRGAEVDTDYRDMIKIEIPITQDCGTMFFTKYYDAVRILEKYNKKEESK